MEQNYDVTLKGVVTTWNGRGVDVLSITVAVMACVVHHKKNVTWNFPEPPLIMLNIQPIAHLSRKQIIDLITPGALIDLHVTGEEADLKIEATARPLKIRGLAEFISSL